MHTSPPKRFRLRQSARNLHRVRTLSMRLRFCLIWLPVMLLAANRVHANGRHEPAGPSAAGIDMKIQGLVDDLRARLSIPQAVTVSLVPKNPLLASVESAKSREGFLLCLEESFATALTEEELEAVIAHELGHVWIFTHHPYLQTEQLANRIAQRLVSRDSLAKVYDKVWKGGLKGDLARFLGEPLPIPQRVSETAAAPLMTAPR